MAESDLSTQSGSDIDQTDGEGIYKPMKPVRTAYKLGSVRAVAIKKVSANQPHPLDLKCFCWI